MAGTRWTALEAIEDRPTKKGRRFPLPAMLSGANDLRAIFRWGRRLLASAYQSVTRI